MTDNLLFFDFISNSRHFKLLTSFTLFTLLRKEALVQTKAQVFSYVEERKKKNMTGYRIETADIVSAD